MKNKQLKTKTYVDNPPIKETTTQSSFQMRFSKSNFMFIGKWIIVFVLVVVFGSQALNGFISSKFTKDSTTETIVHEYKKQIGTEIVGGNFDFLQTAEDMPLLLDKKIYVKQNFILDDFLNFDEKFKWMTVPLFNVNNSSRIYFYDNNDNIVNSVYFKSSTYSLIGLDWKYYYSGINGYRLSEVRLLNSIGATTYASYLTFNRDNNILKYNYPTYSYFILPSQTFSINYTYSYDMSLIRDIMNLFFTTSYDEIPIYETTTYTYEVRDNNYNWDTKLKQLSAFKPLFKFNQSFINEEYLKYNNLISYEFADTDTSRENLVNKYKLDERLKPLFDNNYITIGGKTETGLFKDKTKYYSFIEFNFPLDYDIQGVSSAYNWVIDNYVTDFNIDSYLNESKYKVELKDILEIFNFPIQIVNNLVYNFGVLIGFITWW